MRNTLKNLFIKNYTINNYYGRFGNNLQQIALGIMFSNLNKSNFYLKEHALLDRYENINNKKSNFLKKYRFDSRFYYFDNNSEKFANTSNTDFPLKIDDLNYYLDNFYHIFQNEIFPILNFYKDIDIDDDTIVLHVRSGDIFAKTNDDKIIGNKYYIQNPLVYFLNLIDKYKKAIVVSSQPFNNPVMSALMKNPKVEIQSSNIMEDFNVLLNAKNLATSGIGTFATSAALCSKKLKNLYYSELYFKHHLNPTMLRNTNCVKYKFGNYFRGGDHWTGSKEQIDKVLSDNIKIIES